MGKGRVMAEADAMDEIRNALGVAGREMYGGEAVTQLAHALQCAMLAEREGAAPALTVAALLHDLGHIVDKRFQLGQETPVDRHHEDIGSAYLARWFPPAVTEPIRLHVPAKRYLCRVEPGYFDGLSPASVRSLDLQGGTFTSDEAKAFVAQPYATDAARLRRWDDLAKDPDAGTPPLDHFLGHVSAMLTASQA